MAQLRDAGDLIGNRASRYVSRGPVLVLLAGFLLLACASAFGTGSPVHTGGTAPEALPIAAPAGAGSDVPADPPSPPVSRPLRVLPPEAPTRPLRVLVDAGHGEEKNRGNTSVTCRAEADFTRGLQDATARALFAFSGLTVRSSRPDALPVSYDARLRDLAAWPADAVISLHSDARAAANPAIDAQSGCWGETGATGFALLYSDEGEEPLVTARRRLAVELSAAMVDAGFEPYDGTDYPGLYGKEGEGVFVDRHTMKKRIRMLRRSKVPLVIVETHQALDRADVALWDDPATAPAFASAVARAVVRANR